MLARGRRIGVALRFPALRFPPRHEYVMSSQGGDNSILIGDHPKKIFFRNRKQQKHEALIILEYLYKVGPEQPQQPLPNGRNNIGFTGVI